MELQINEKVIEGLTLEYKLKRNIKCFSCDIQDRNFNLYIFTYEFKDEKDFLETFKTINNSIAFDFQRTLIKEIERWNLYFIAFVNSEVSEQAKNAFEQDKYATRKIVYDGVSNTTIEGIKGVIYKKLFNLELNSREPEQKIMSGETVQTLSTFLTNTEHQKLKIMNKTITNMTKKKSIAENYLKEILNEQKNI
ncbi:MAG: ABC-three component system middle component 1 [Solibacillus sp.]|uniref:ABC-three component system middle component 1 n=1 Tax=Solibacillus sp. TaxID=1909654 RepID=UPI0033160DF4